MGLELAKAFVRVRGDTGQMAQDFNQAKPKVLSSLRGLAASASAILGTIGAGVVISKSIGQLKEFVGLAERQVQAEQRVAAVIRTTGKAAGFTAKELQAQAAALQKVTTVGDEEILELQAILLTFKAISGDAFQTTTELALDLAAVLGTDAKSGALQLGKALEDPIRGITALRRAGVSFSEQQKEQIKILQESNRLREAQEIVLQGVAGQIGGVAKELAKTDAGKLQQARNVLGDMREELGKKLIPATTSFIKLQMKLIPIMDKVGKVMQAVGDFIANNTGLLIQLGGAFLAAKVAIIAVNAVIAIYTAAVTAAAAATTFLTALGGPIGVVKIVAGFAAATAAVVLMNRSLSETKQAVKGAKEEAVKLPEPIRKTADLKSGIDSLVSSFESLEDVFKKIGPIQSEMVRKMIKDFEEVDKRIKFSREQLQIALEARRTHTGGSPEDIRILTKQFDEAVGRTVKLEELVRVFGSVAKAAEFLGETLDEIGITPQEEIDKLREKLKALVDSGLLPVEKAQQRLAGTPFFKEIEQGRKKAEEESKRRQTDLTKEGRQITESLRTPAEQSLAEVKRLRRFFDLGKIGPEAFKRGLLAQQRGLTGDIQSPSMIQGRMGFGQLGKSIQDAVLQKKDPVVKEVEKTNRILDIIKGLLGEDRNNAAVLVAGDN